ncbi:MAG: Rne/Rng family ribonuclease [Phycisphaerales bacterium]|nr:Rne/Rng family ribonuclease [Phycisphaerales bacterium]
MVVNDVPGEECRIAILQDGHLEELYAERVTATSSVGNIYKGRVTNVESAIQAAFVDFGHAQRGFLHISDLHPKYFPGGGKTEKVGRKTARRDRPLMQNCLKRGQEIIVQVLKEGIGTKGPTLTSYLSIPGRMMVMMPNMGRVGVTRKVEDDDERRSMRDVLDKLDLPDNFGFILRTAGMGRTKLELKRDVAYLTRLWKVMEKRNESVGAPCELYTESDLLIRTIRDVLRPSIKAVIVDSDSALERCNAFLRVIAPRSAPKIIRYRRGLPLFHAFDIERQIDVIHQREVSLPSGGRLVIDQTEALVAVDVNSGRSRSAKDSETNAFNTNMEAADEICRQLRLRDLGGLVINDLIDMRHMRHRRQVEDRFALNLERDRARTTVLKISEFGIMEMTRQRMRPSMRMSHFIGCPACDAQGEIKSPDSVATDVVRNIGYLLQHRDVARVEVVVSSKVASVLLSTRRRHLTVLEEQLEKQVDVRVSETIAADRVNFYAYDSTNTDLELERLIKPAMPTIEELANEESNPVVENEESTGGRSGSRRRRRRNTAPPADAAAIALSGELMKELEELDEEAEQEELKAAASDAAGPDADAGEDGDGEEDGTRRRRRRRSRGRRGGRGRKPSSTPVSVEPPIDSPSRLYVLAKKIDTDSKEILRRIAESTDESVKTWVVKNHMSMVTPEQAQIIAGWFVEVTEPAEPEVADKESESGDEAAPRRRRRRRRRRGSRGSGEQDESASDGEESVESSEEDGDEQEAPKKKRRRRSRRKKTTTSSDEGAGSQDATGDSMDDSGEASGESTSGKKRSRRGSRGRGRGRKPSGAAASESEGSTAAVAAPAVAEKTESKPKPQRRTLYGASRRGLSKSEVDAAKEQDA